MDVACRLSAVVKAAVAGCSRLMDEAMQRTLPILPVTVDMFPRNAEMP